PCQVRCRRASHPCCLHASSSMSPVHTFLTHGYDASIVHPWLTAPGYDIPNFQSLRY
uniref:Uncharacterized protein n=1 Tax=Oryza brachyantha TaxID=4533 RepID=J3MH81_ORYBR